MWLPAPLLHLQVLENRTRGISQAARWVAANRGQVFRGQVYGPIAAEVECLNPQHATFLEAAVPGERGGVPQPPARHLPGGGSAS